MKLCKYHSICEEIGEECYDKFIEKCFIYKRLEKEKGLEEIELDLHKTKQK